MRTIYLYLLFFVSVSSSFIGNAQISPTNITISGAIKDAENGETLIGASVYIPTQTVGTTTNEYGFYSLTIPKSGELEVEISYVGYQTVRKKIKADKNLTLNVELGNGLLLDEVVVKANSFREQLQSTEMSVEAITAKEAKMLPALLGESDILKVLQLKPGIPSGSEGSTGLYVRGGGTDQNLIVLDEAVVYNANHLFGFFSTFNTDAVKDLKLYKGGFPPQYGGRLSSVIDVKLKEGNNKKLEGTGGIGLIASRLTLEGPIQKGKSSFIVSGRRTYFDLITRQINKSRSDNPNATQIPNYYFYDLNTKVNFTLSEKDRLFISGYFGRDEFGFNSDFFNFDFNWGNATGTARWNHVFNPKLFANTTFTYSDYQYNITNRITGFSFNLGSQISDTNLKTDFYYAPNNQHTIRFGANATNHFFRVGRLKAGSDDGEISFSAGQDFDGIETGIYVSDDYLISKNMEVSGGLRYSSFFNDGEFFHRLEPRVNFRYNPLEILTLKASYARMNQYLHLVSNSGIALPTDVWYPTTANVRPQQSDQIAIGGSILLGSDWFLTNEYYYKWLDNQVDFVDGAQLFANNNLEQEFAIGKGRGYGMEVSIEKREGRLTGWIGYTLAKIERGAFRPINPDKIFGEGLGYFSPRYDRRHDVSVVAVYEISPRLTATATYVYGSGDLTWLPSGRFTFQDIYGGASQAVVPVYGSRNNYRVPAFIRMDMGLVWKFKPRWGESDITFNVINALNRRNAFFLYLEPQFKDGTDTSGLPIQVPERIAAKQVSLFPIIPAFTWNFSF